MRAFVLRVPVEEIDVASDLLWQLGVRAIEERQIDASHVELWTAVGDGFDAGERASAVVGERWFARFVEVVDDSAQTWRDFAHPIWVDEGLVIAPAWQAHEFADGVVAISIEPGGAFGLGDHPTTLLSLRAIRRIIGPGCSVLDVGSGTGVLSVASLLLGAATARAVDVAAAAVEATLDNADRNGVAALVEVDTSPISELDGTFDLVVANILAPTLVELAGDLRRLTAPTGRLVISGILSDRHDHVLAALAPMIVERTDTLDGWAAVTLGHARR